MLLYPKYIIRTMMFCFKSLVSMIYYLCLILNQLWLTTMCLHVLTIASQFLNFTTIQEEVPNYFNMSSTEKSSHYFQYMYQRPTILDQINEMKLKFLIATWKNGLSPTLQYHYCQHHSTTSFETMIYDKCDSVAISNSHQLFADFLSDK